MNLKNAQASLKNAEENLNRAQLIDNLCSRRGLVYGALSSDSSAVALVAHDGQIIGEVFTTTPGAVLNWYARRTPDEEPMGPYLTARAAAVRLLPQGNNQ